MSMGSCNKKFRPKFSGLTLNTKLYKKNKCRYDSLIPGLTLTNSSNACFLKRFFPKVLSNFWYTRTPAEQLSNLLMPESNFYKFTFESFCVYAVIK